MGDFRAENGTHAALEAALRHVNVQWEWIATDAVPPAALLAERYAGFWIASATPVRMDGALEAISFARQHRVPVVATCAGFAHVLVEYARNVLHLAEADHAGMRPDGRTLVVTPLTCSIVGQSDYVRVLPDSLAASLYGVVGEVVEDFYCNYGLNADYRPMLEDAGMLVTGVDKNDAVRIIELPPDVHPFFLATLYSFQTRSRPYEPHPFLTGFLEAARSVAFA